MSDQVRARAPSSTARWVYWTAGASGLGLGFLFTFLFVVTLRADWGVTQWGPFAAWASSLFAMIAVGVAVTQTILTRRDAAESRKRHRQDLKTLEKRHRRDLKAANRRHREQLNAQATASARNEQFQSVREISAALNIIYLDTLAFTDKFRFETDVTVATEQFLRHKIPWARKTSQQTREIQLSLIGVTDAKLQEFARSALDETAALYQEVTESALSESLDLVRVDEHTHAIFGSMRVITSWAIGTMQPAFLAAAVAAFEEKQSGNTD